MVKATPKPTSVFARLKSASADSSDSAIYAVRRFKQPILSTAAQTSGERSSITLGRRVDPADWRRNKCAATLSGRGINMDALQRPRTLIKYTLSEIR